jgi:hypothetical protein
MGMRKGYHTHKLEVDRLEVGGKPPSLWAVTSQTRYFGRYATNF